MAKAKKISSEEQAALDAVRQLIPARLRCNCEDPRGSGRFEHDGVDRPLGIARPDLPYDPHVRIAAALKQVMP